MSCVNYYYNPAVQSIHTRNKSFGSFCLYNCDTMKQWDEKYRWQKILDGKRGGGWLATLSTPPGSAPAGLVGVPQW